MAEPTRPAPAPLTVVAPLSHLEPGHSNATANVSSYECDDEMEGTATVIGAPDDLVDAVRQMKEITGGFGCVIGFAHDWASCEATRRCLDMVARYVIPEVNGLLEPYRESQRWVRENRGSFERAGEATLSKIMQNERAAKAMEETLQGQAAMPPHHAPDLEKGKTEP